MLHTVLAMAAGAVLAYFLDPDRGRGRRSTTTARVRGAARRGGSRLGRLWRRGATTQVAALGQRIVPPHLEEVEPPNDATLTQKVETEVFRDFHVLKGKINLNAERGIIVLRGQLDDQAQIAAVEAAASQVPGVEGVKNLLHLPNTPAPTS